MAVKPLPAFARSFDRLRMTATSLAFAALRQAQDDSRSPPRAGNSGWLPVQQPTSNCQLPS